MKTIEVLVRFSETLTDLIKQKVVECNWSEVSAIADDLRELDHNIMFLEQYEAKGIVAIKTPVATQQQEDETSKRITEYAALLMQDINNQPSLLKVMEKYKFVP